MTLRFGTRHIKVRCPFAPHYCGPHEYAARIAAEVVLLLAGLGALAHVTWFAQQPFSLRGAIVMGLAYVSAASAGTLRRLPGGARS